MSLSAKSALTSCFGENNSITVALINVMLLLIYYLYLSILLSNYNGNVHGGKRMQYEFRIGMQRSLVFIFFHYVVGFVLVMSFLHTCVYFLTVLYKLCLWSSLSFCTCFPTKNTSCVLFWQWPWDGLICFISPEASSPWAFTVLWFKRQVRFVLFICLIIWYNPNQPYSAIWMYFIVHTEISYFQFICYFSRIHSITSMVETSLYVKNNILLY